MKTTVVSLFLCTCWIAVWTAAHASEGAKIEKQKQKVLRYANSEIPAQIALLRRGVQRFSASFKTSAASVQKLRRDVDSLDGNLKETLRKISACYSRSKFQKDKKHEDCVIKKPPGLKKAPALSELVFLHRQVVSNMLADGFSQQMDTLLRSLLSKRQKELAAQLKELENQRKNRELVELLAGMSEEDRQKLAAFAHGRDLLAIIFEAKNNLLDTLQKMMVAMRHSMEKVLRGAGRF